ncbi:MAG: hypothetical protein Q9190_007532 [Brigantiaea leucoxantha]
MEEEDSMMQDALPTPESNQENKAPAKARGKVKSSTNKVTKAKARRVSVKSIVARKKSAPKSKGIKKRPPLGEQNNNQKAEDTEEVDDFDGRDHVHFDDEKSAISMDELVAMKLSPQKRRTVPKTKKKVGKKPKDGEAPQQTKAGASDDEFEFTPTTARQIKSMKARPQPRKKPAAAQHKQPIEPKRNVKIIPDTQDFPMEPETQMENNEGEEIPQSVYRKVPNAQVRPPSRQPSVTRHRAGSASETERGVAANDLISSLKKELSTQRSLALESRTLQTHLLEKDTDISKAQALAESLSASLSEAQNENRALQAKLANSRNASSSSAAIECANSAKPPPPSSAIKGGRQQTPGQRRTIMVGSAEAAAQAAQTAQLKEDLYSDLTGLIIRSVEKGAGAEADVYDCIQTGRNGTLHFKLAISEATADGGSYEDAEFQYEPRLDSNRDKDLLELLPDYLSEEISFSRTNAAKFYGRVVETLTRRRVEEGEVGR